MLATMLSALLVCQFGMPAPMKEPVEGKRKADCWEAVQGDIRVLVRNVDVDFVRLRKFGGGIKRSESKHLNIFFGIYNYSDTRKRQYWSVSELRAVCLATLKDDLGNTYKQMMFGADEPLLQTKSQSIYPGYFVTDLLVFEEPVEAAKRLTLTIPAKSLEMEADMIFEIDLEEVPGSRPWTALQVRREAAERILAEAERMQREAEEAERKERVFKALTAKFEIVADPFGKEDMIGVRVTVTNADQDDATAIIVELRDAKKSLDKHKVTRVRSLKAASYIARIPKGCVPTDAVVVSCTVPPLKRRGSAKPVR